jgi:dCTP deaminase
MLDARLFDPPNWLRVDEIVCGAWVAWIHEGPATEGSDRWEKRRRVTSRLALRGIELSDYLRKHLSVGNPEEEQEIRRHFEEARNDLATVAAAGEETARTGVVNRRGVLLAMSKRKLSDKLVVTPLLDAEQIGEASVDIRLGNGFIAIRRARTRRIKVTPSLFLGPGDYIDRISLSYDGMIILHPGEFMLGSSLEYICLPADMMAYVIGKSSLGRLGLIIATATHVAPGYKGTLTLELSNVGTVPIELTPRIPVAQLVLHRLEDPITTPYHKRGKYAYTTGPEMPPLALEPD